jgi:hypothetical protein
VRNPGDATALARFVAVVCPRE